MKELRTKMALKNLPFLGKKFELNKVLLERFSKINHLQINDYIIDDHHYANDVNYYDATVNKSCLKILFYQ